MAASLQERIHSWAAHRGKHSRIRWSLREGHLVRGAGFCWGVVWLRAGLPRPCACVTLSGSRQDEVAAAIGVADHWHVQAEQQCYRGGGIPGGGVMRRDRYPPGMTAKRFAVARDPLIRRLMAHQMLATVRLFAYAGDLAAVMDRLRHELPHVSAVLERWAAVSGVALRPAKDVFLQLLGRWDRADARVLAGTARGWRVQRATSEPLSARTRSVAGGRRQIVREPAMWQPAALRGRYSWSCSTCIVAALCGTERSSRRRTP